MTAVNFEPGTVVHLNGRPFTLLSAAHAAQGAVATPAGSGSKDPRCGVAHSMRPEDFAALLIAQLGRQGAAAFLARCQDDFWAHGLKTMRTRFDFDEATPLAQQYAAMVDGTAWFHSVSVAIQAT